MRNKKITKDELEVFLRKHKLWLADDPEGERADLREADLREADLREADLWGADLREADLREADLQGADLREANLQGADLWGADLREANLWGADLQRADLRKADLRKADLQRADLREANLWGADLREANLWGADLRKADLQRADLREAKDLFYPIACPEKGSFTAFKKARGYIVELEVPEDALRCSASSRKCRCSHARVISITNLDGSDAGITTIASSYDKNFIYTVGEIVKVDNFDENRWNECSTGVHFFITRQEAVNYNN